MAHGCTHPQNVIADVNPFDYAPSCLPDRIWFLINSEEKEPREHGLWKVRGGASKLFSNSSITGWRTTLEYFEGQVPHELKTDWIMQEYWITQKGLCENSKVKESSSLCRVFLSHEQDHRRQQEMSSLPIANEILIHSTHSVVSDAHNVTNRGSTSKPAVEKDDETGNLALTGEPANYPVEMLLDNDYFSGGDYLELLDLDEPASTSSSSDNSSCSTISSDECFDSLALLKELDSETNQDLVQKDENCKFSISTSTRPNEVVMAPASPGSFVSIKASTEEVVQTDSSLPRLANGHKDLDNEVLQNTNQKANHREAGPSSSHEVSTSGEAVKGRKKKLKNKYLCFMPLYILF